MNDEAGCCAICSVSSLFVWLLSKRLMVKTAGRGTWSLGFAEQFCTEVVHASKHSSRQLRQIMSPLFNGIYGWSS